MYILSESFCNSPNIQTLFKFLGYIIKIIHILVPIIIILFVIIDLVKMIIFNNNKNYKFLIKRLIMAVMIFFIIPITIYLLNIINSNYEYECFDCFLNPDSCKPKNSSIICTDDKCCKNNFGNNLKYDELEGKCVEILSYEKQY